MLYYYKFSKVKCHRDIVVEYSEFLLQRFGKEFNLHTYSGGLSGILYLFEFLKENELVEIDISDVKESFEEYLIRMMRNDILGDNYDFMHGALGIGLYFLKSKTHEEIIQELITFLLNTSEIDSESGGVKWKSKIDEDFIGYNIALSHGMASIVLFLCRVIENGYGNDKVKELLSKIVKYVLYQEIDVNKYGSFFPTYSKESSIPLSGSRLAWCYGDLGIAYAILRAGEVTKSQNWVDKGLSILLQSINRKSNVYKSGICHGCSSMLMIYQHMFIKTKIPAFAEGVEYWIQKSLELSCHQDGPAGYKSYYMKKWVSDYSLLSGISGIGLNYLSYLENDNSCWDEIFLL